MLTHELGKVTWDNPFLQHLAGVTFPGDCAAPKSWVHTAGRLTVLRVIVQGLPKM